MRSDFEEPGDDDVLQKVLGDLTGKVAQASQKLVRKRMDELMAVAKDQIMKEG